MDVNPSSVGHTLVAPRCHLETIIDVPEKLLAAIFSTVKTVSAAVNKTIEPDGVTILQLNGRAAGQSVMHFHVHIIPRFKGDSISKALGAMVEHHGTKKPKREELDQIAKKIRENL
jgi:histidine triad (HIT) family protein